MEGLDWGKSGVLPRNRRLRSRVVLEQRVDSVRLHNQRREEWRWSGGMVGFRPTG